MDKIKIRVGRSDSIMMCFCRTSFLFLAMNLIESIVYKLCAGYEMHKLYYKLHVDYGYYECYGLSSLFDHAGRPTF